MGAFVSALTSPFPSIGLPSASITRPFNPPPTGTSKILPVVFTFWPSFICPASPRTTAPTESFSRLSASPYVASPKSNNSPYIASSSPKI